MVGRKKLATFAACFLLAVLAFTSCERFDKSLAGGLEEEKSYTRHAMEYHRQHPEKRHGDTVLDTWSAADYVAVDVAKEKVPGEWAKPSDQLSFLQATMKTDLEGVPFCVVQRADAIIVIRVLDKRSFECTLESAKRLDLSHIHSGDMEFSGRTDYWIYVLKR